MPSFKLLSIMLDNLGSNPRIRDACLSYDEMLGQAKLEYDPGTQQIVGYANLPSNIASDEKQVATHDMVFILSGLTVRWKMPVAYYYTHKGSFAPSHSVTGGETVRYQECTFSDALLVHSSEAKIMLCHVAMYLIDDNTFTVLNFNCGGSL